MANTHVTGGLGGRPAGSEKLAELRSDGARMAPHWPPFLGAGAEPVPPSLIHGVVVPPASARLTDAMGDYGN
ncbi:hypothetical protein [Streptomyces sp. NPDC060194]|uniref:hypothetical protein n=1 Tax=Streptomyces sp. NPDC060194 TaxID=3347069 RepID=UPI0036493CFE